LQKLIICISFSIFLVSKPFLEKIDDFYFFSSKCYFEKNIIKIKKFQKKFSSIFCFRINSPYLFMMHKIQILQKCHIDFEKEQKQEFMGVFHWN